MSQSFDSLTHGGGGSGRRDYAERQSSEDVPDSTATTTTTTAGDLAAGTAAATLRDDEFSEDNNFESNLRRRKGKIISCAKETIENGKNVSLIHMYMLHILYRMLLTSNPFEKYIFNSLRN